MVEKNLTRVDIDAISHQRKYSRSFRCQAKRIEQFEKKTMCLTGLKIMLTMLIMLAAFCLSGYSQGNKKRMEDIEDLINGTGASGKTLK